MDLEQYQVTFEGNRLDLVPGVDLYNYDFTTLPLRDIKIHKIARRSLSIITSAEYTQKSIPVWMDICSGTRQETEATVTDIKALLQPQNGVLQVLQSGLQVQYTATMNEFIVEWNGTHAYAQIVFLASTPIGTASSSDQLVGITGSTTSSASSTFTVEGSAIAEPYITVVVNSVTGGTGQQITLVNASTNQGITVEANWVSGDILEVDSKNMVVRINGGLVDFTGMFPMFPPGSQQLTYTDSFTTRNVNITMTYNQRLV